MKENIKHNLLTELVERYLADFSGVSAPTFRIDNEDYFSEIDELEQGPFIERDGDTYHVNILFLADLKKEIASLDMHLHRCEHVFHGLRECYKENPGVTIPLSVLAHKVDLPESQIRKSLLILRKVPIWGGYTTDILGSDDVTVTPGENILRYKTFDDVLEKVREWNHAASIESDSGAIGGMFLSRNALISQNIEADNLSVSPNWYTDLPSNVYELIREIQAARGVGLSSLPSMGLRTILDIAFTELVGDIGGFKSKLNKMKEDNHITSKKKMIIENVLEVGHASAHRGHFPSEEELDDVVDIVNHLLFETYVMGSKSDALKKSTPRRG